MRSPIESLRWPWARETLGPWDPLGAPGAEAEVGADWDSETAAGAGILFLPFGNREGYGYTW